MYLPCPSAQVFMLPVEVQEAWYKDWPSVIRVIILAGALRAVSSGFPVKCPHRGTWSHPTLNKLQGEFQMHLFGLEWIFFCISDRWKEGYVSDACRNVNAVMLPVVGGILLLWWSVFLNHYFKMPFLCVLCIIGRGSRQVVYFWVQVYLCFLSFLSPNLSTFLKWNNTTKLCTYLLLLCFSW